MTTLVSSLLVSPVYAETNLDYYESNKNKINVNNKQADEELKEQTKMYGNIKDDKDENTFKLGLRGGALSLTMSNSENIIFGEGMDTLADERIPLNFKGTLHVSDLRATGEGWHLTLEAEPLTEVPKEGGKEPKSGWFKAPTGTILMTSTPTVTSSDSNITEGLPNVDFYGRESEFAIDNGPVTVVSAYYGEGMGDWDITLPEGSIQVILSKENVKQDLVNYPDTPTPYATTLKWTLVSGPGTE